MASFAFVPWVMRVECGPFVPDTQDSVCNMDTLRAQPVLLPLTIKTVPDTQDSVYNMDTLRA